MAYKVVYFDEVKLDIKEAKQWYKKQSAGLEKSFAKAIKNSINHLIQTPYTHAIRYRKVSISHPSVFPYSIHYYLNESNSFIVITAIVHDSRDSSFSLERL